MELGNHTYSHPDLNTMPPEQYQVDILKGELVTRKLMSDRGQALHWFRHPFTHTGPTAAIKAQIDGFLGAHGYTSRRSRSRPPTMCSRWSTSVQRWQTTRRQLTR